MSRPYLSASSFRSHRLIATASERSEATNEISSLKPFCFRSRGRTSFSSVWVNSPAVLAFRCMDTLRAYISTPWLLRREPTRDHYACLWVLQPLSAQYIPPMPPPPGIEGTFSFSFFSTTTHSVVRSSPAMDAAFCSAVRSEEHTSELQSPCNLVCRLLLEKKKNTYID